MRIASIRLTGRSFPRTGTDESIGGPRTTLEQSREEGPGSVLRRLAREERCRDFGTNGMGQRRARRCWFGGSSRDLGVVTRKDYQLLLSLRFIANCVDYRDDALDQLRIDVLRVLSKE